MDLPAPTLSAQARKIQRANEGGARRLEGAILSGSVDAVEAILAEGLQEVLLGHRFKNNGSALHLAARTGCQEIVSLLIDRYGMDVNMADDKGNTPLHSACSAGHDVVVALLLDKGAKPHAATYAERDTPLHLALMKKHELVARVLLDRQVADVHARRKTGATAFYVAIEKGLLDSAERLRIQGADVHTPTATGASPLHRACSAGTADTVRWLLQNGAHLQDVKMPENWTLVHAAAMNRRHPDVIDALRNAMPAAAFKTLACTPDRWNATPDMLAAECSQPAEVVRGLLLNEVVVPVLGKPAKHPRTWVILGPKQHNVDFAPVRHAGLASDIEIGTYGNGRQNLSWGETQALAVRSGDALAIQCHGSMNKLTGRLMLSFSEQEKVPLVDLVLHMIDQGVLHFLLAGCEFVQALEALLNRLRHALATRWPDKRMVEGLRITVLGSGGYTLMPLNRDGLRLWVKDTTTLLSTGKAGDALEREGVQEIHELAWDGTAFVTRARAKLRADDVAEHLKPALLFMHVGDGNAAEVAPLIDKHGLDPNFQDETGVSLLNLACVHGHAEVIRFLLQQPGIQINLPTRGGHTPLWTACRNGQSEVVKLLLDKGAQIDRAETTEGATPLWGACGNGHAAVVKQLLAKGADIHLAQTKHGQTPLWIACRHGHIEVVRLLLAAGADRGALAKDGTTAWSIALKTGNQALIDVLASTTPPPSGAPSC
ncbi:ankyrin repeat domain-containing protein [Hydrogenophaga sp.]|uniref:ankyrin repeat domain-containing protein n=1 Tax=Hydrogenophaga sp. TaxID=1904254 RepID=UPI0027170B73|nr:ankyrin repeat domain-containing protein [Hydrogenophaga sp.]MDO9438573.1 ankyrin repeat domain-containing protein [Hydrogenophaga sp.]